MKPLTALLFLTIAATGVACSDAVKSNAEAAPAPTGSEPLPVDTSTATSETELGGTLNLNIGGSQASSSGRLLGSGGLSGSSDSGIVLGSGGLAGGNFGSGPDLGIELEEDDASSLLTAPGEQPKKPASDEDDIVRLPN